MTAKPITLTVALSLLLASLALPPSAVAHAGRDNPPPNPFGEPGLTTGHRPVAPQDQGHLRGGPPDLPSIEAWYVPFNCSAGQAAFLWLRNYTNAFPLVVIQWYSQMASTAYSANMEPGDTVYYASPTHPQDRVLYALWSTSGYLVMEMGHWCGG